MKTSAPTTGAGRSTVRMGSLCVVGFAAVLFAGCGELEPLREPEVVDLQLTTDTLKTSVRDAQRMVAELRTDLESRRRELAEAQVARAQLEGRVREAERRVIEARQVIELQREELAVARTERERVSRSSRHLQGQMKQSQKPLPKTKQSATLNDGLEMPPLPSGGPVRKGRQVPAQRSQSLEFPEPSRAMATSAAVVEVSANREPSAETAPQKTPPRSVSVKPGDTLWRIAQTYRVNVEQLRAFNQLTDNRIVIGQALWLSDDRSMRDAGSR